MSYLHWKELTSQGAQLRRARDPNTGTTWIIGTWPNGDKVTTTRHYLQWRRSDGVWRVQYRNNHYLFESLKRGFPAMTNNLPTGLPADFEEHLITIKGWHAKDT